VKTPWKVGAGGAVSTATTNLVAEVRQSGINSEVRRWRRWAAEQASVERAMLARGYPDPLPH
jgi:hypothetical protein